MRRTATTLARNRYLFPSFDSKPPFHSYLPTHLFLDGIRSWSRPCAFVNPDIAPGFVHISSRKAPFRVLAAQAWRRTSRARRHNRHHFDLDCALAGRSHRSRWCVRVASMDDLEGGWDVDGTGWRRRTRRKASTADECPKGNNGRWETPGWRADATWTARWNVHVPSQEMALVPPRPRSNGMGTCEEANAICHPRDER